MEVVLGLFIKNTKRIKHKDTKRIHAAQRLGLIPMMYWMFWLIRFTIKLFARYSVTIPKTPAVKLEPNKAATTNHQSINLLN